MTFSTTNDATHDIVIDDVTMTMVRGYDSSFGEQSKSSSLVLHLSAGQTVAVNPSSTTYFGAHPYKRNLFGATLLHFD